MAMSRAHPAAQGTMQGALLPEALPPLVTLVLAGMAAQSDLEVALKLPNVTRIVLYNHAAETLCDDAVSKAGGVWCGTSCAQLSWNSSAGLDVECFDVPNLGRSEGSFMSHVVSEYERLEGTVVFTASTFREGREEGVSAMLTGQEFVSDGGYLPAGPLTEPACLMAPRMQPLMEPGFLLNARHEGNPPANAHNHRDFSYSEPRFNFEGYKPICFLSDAVGTASTRCNISYVDGEDATSGKMSVRAQTIGKAEPNTLSTWLRAHAPGPEATRSPYCWRGFFRTTGDALRLRPLAHYASLRDELMRDPNPEGAWFVERAGMYLFAYR